MTPSYHTTNKTAKNEVKVYNLTLGQLLQSSKVDWDPKKELWEMFPLWKTTQIVYGCVGL